MKIREIIPEAFSAIGNGSSASPGAPVAPAAPATPNMTAVPPAPSVGTATANVANVSNQQSPTPITNTPATPPDPTLVKGASVKMPGPNGIETDGTISDVNLVNKTATVQNTRPKSGQPVSDTYSLQDLTTLLNAMKK